MSWKREGGGEEYLYLHQCCTPLTHFLSLLVLQDESSHFWTLSLSAVGPAGTLLLGRLEGFFQQNGARDGDCVVVSPQPDGSMLLQLGQAQNDRQASTPPPPGLSPCICLQTLNLAAAPNIHPHTDKATTSQFIHYMMLLCGKDVFRGGEGLWVFSTCQIGMHGLDDL